MNYSLNQLYKVVGISKQAVAKYEYRRQEIESKLYDLMVQADAIRRVHPGCGVEKLYYTLKPDFIGRDRFIEVFMDMGYRLKIKKNYRKTTQSSNKYFPNLIKGMEINEIGAIWQSDITYFEVGLRFYYGVFIKDVYSREIVGYAVSDHMRAEANIRALKMALKRHKAPKIHHSDRGSQYVCKKYLEILKSNGTEISMGLTAQDNAYIERFNGTIKNEYLQYWDIKDFNSLKRKVSKAIKQYNNERIHNGHKPLRMSPVKLKNYVVNLPKQERPTVIIYTESQNTNSGASSPQISKQELPLAHNCPNINFKNNQNNKSNINQKTVNLI